MPLLLVGCTTVEDDRICLDWGHYPIVEERCTPLYGSIVCTVEERTRYWCKLYEEKTDG
jgi:hypothetical protein